MRTVWRVEVPGGLVYEMGVLGVNARVARLWREQFGLAASWCSYSTLRDRRGELGVAMAADVVVAGSVRFVRTGLAQLGASLPGAMGFPAQLMPMLGRRVEQVTAREAIVRASARRVFVKPAATLKLFVGGCTDELEVIDALQRIDADTPVFVADPVRFLAEWRCFVIDGTVRAVAQYLPDGAVWPDPDPGFVADAAAAVFDAYRYAGFSVDVGLLDDGRYAVVEANDGYALGDYGIEIGVYAELMWRRWHEMATSGAGRTAAA